MERFILYEQNLWVYDNETMDVDVPGSEYNFLFHGCGFWTALENRARVASQVGSIRRFREYFGCSPGLCALIWSWLVFNVDDDALPIHLLWTLLFLKQYQTEAVSSGLCRVNERTYRERIWSVIQKLAELNVVSLCFVVRCCCFGCCLIPLLLT